MNDAVDRNAEEVARMKNELMSQGWTAAEADHYIEHSPLARLAIARCEFVRTVTESFRPAIEKASKSIARALSRKSGE